MHVVLLADMSDSVRPASEAAVQAASSQQATLVICTRNRPVLLQNCLEGIRNLNQQPQEVIVVDNTDGDEATHSIAEQFGAKYILEPSPGLSRARNRGLMEARAEIVAFLDDDAVPSPEWLGQILSAFQDPHLGAASGQIITPGTKQQGSLAELPRLLDKQNPKWLEIASFGGMGLGSNMALRRSACVGRVIFDERLGRGAPFQIAEEHFAFAYLVSLGYSVRYIPKAIVFHPPLRNDSIAMEARNAIAYFLLLLAEFPSQRLKLLQFLLGRLRGKPLTWARDSQQPGTLVTSNWSTKLKAAYSGLWLYMKTPRRPKTIGSGYKSRDSTRD
ncbi:MAG TPA: glycosyltransferase family 2 protein [Terracidiphilus sp.]|nr:glycosyltransferase family 2 protein [Terracidiphilus sp.]